MNDIGKLIAAKRSEKNLSIRALATICGISHSEVSKIEDGRRKNPSALHLKLIADALGIDQILIMTKAGYIDPVKDRTLSSFPFSDFEELSGEEINTVQLFINFLVSRHKNANQNKK